jgi:hypothetical protein
MSIITIKNGFTIATDGVKFAVVNTKRDPQEKDFIFNTLQLANFWLAAITGE